MIVAGSANPLLLASSAKPYLLERSLRLRSSASAYFNKSFSADVPTYTISVWVKRGKLGASQQIASSRLAGVASNIFSFNGSDNLYFEAFNTTIFTTTAVYRDPSAWYHIVLSVTQSGTAFAYVNGVQVASGAVGALSAIYKTGYTNVIGRAGDLNADYFDGYLAEFNFIDGQALTPSSFGSTSATTGVWQPKKYIGTYGTQGFYLPFTDNSGATSTTIGKDFSGNSNNWTPNNISVTAGATYDSMTDVPTLTSATASNYPTLNPLIGDATLSSANLNISGVDLSRIGTMAFPTTGKWYFEMTLVANAPSSNWDGVGIGSVPMNTASGSIYIYRANATKLQTGGSNVSYGSTFETGDVIGVAFDSTAGTLVFYKNNTSQGTAFSGITGEFFPLVYARGITSSPTLAFNAGQRPFAYTPPTGFVALNTFNLPTPSIGATASTQANKYFDVSLYTGTGSAFSVTNGGFQPEFLWIKARNTVANHVLVDAVRGSNKVINSNLTNAESTSDSGTGVTSFNSNGFSLGTNNSAVGETNFSGSTYVAWQWDAGGTGVTNTAGSITSTVSANTSAGFSIVTYTGNGSTGATVGHGLGVAPSMVIVKKRSSTGNWITYHVSTGVNQYLYLNQTAAAATATPTWGVSSTTVTFQQSFSDYNDSGVTYVMYAFSEVAGYSKFGSYTGNGSTDGAFVYLGFRPRYIMVRKTNDTGAWTIYDTTRSIYNVQALDLEANNSNAEADLTGGAYNFDFVSNGIKFRGNGNSQNLSGATYIYMAFAESPFKYANAR